MNRTTTVSWTCSRSPFTSLITGVISARTSTGCGARASHPANACLHISQKCFHTASISPKLGHNFTVDLHLDTAWLSGTRVVPYVVGVDRGVHSIRGKSDASDDLDAGARRHAPAAVRRGPANLGDRSPHGADQKHHHRPPPSEWHVAAGDWGQNRAATPFSR